MMGILIVFGKLMAMHKTVNHIECFSASTNSLPTVEAKKYDKKASAGQHNTKKPIFVNKETDSVDPNDDMVKHGINIKVDSLDTVCRESFDRSGLLAGYLDATNPTQQTKNTLNMAWSESSTSVQKISAFIFSCPQPLANPQKADWMLITVFTHSTTHQQDVF
jgi:hypothetical protein